MGRIPVYYKGNRRSVLGPAEPVSWPSYTDKLDDECAVAAGVGRGGRDLSAADAAAYVFGCTIMNDWSARDIQRDEMSCWLGPAKGKDLATSLGPWLVTPDEWSPEDAHEMTVHVDGELWSRGRTSGRRWTFPEMLAWVSRDEDLWPTDGAGLRHVRRWMRPRPRPVDRPRPGRDSAGRRPERADEHRRTPGLTPRRHPM